ncbi:hypothetical protein [Apibacter sp. HY039]|uniref:hypothetical protein n=1 Tax=Apibacter sp. HY039 TaxID=2501476 RepID=UPI000FEBD953|nr:hypothetical protein [Apibacter sp. HY039]
MKNKLKENLLLRLIVLCVITISLISCSNDDEFIDTDRIQKSELVFTEVSGEGLYAHGDHFHGIAGSTEGDKTTVQFNSKGDAISGNPVKLKPGAIYKVELKSWNQNGAEVQQNYIANKTIADSYKAFIIGGNFVLNSNSATGTGAVFQPRELNYADGTAVSGKYETTGVLSYFTLGSDNAEGAKNVKYVMRKLVTNVKKSIERVDWNREDYQTSFIGNDELVLKYIIASK